ncbi:hypothetical protein CHARACLAT_005192 [Characodon lateralis]|uniref:LITAF domain-containing protein n=1 Tax=Characodon lateralis TaxID=208331 RepID=A0ABU7DSH8_9TELE|nr:hypothetical protein [Characodon lateralis]
MPGSPFPPLPGHFAQPMPGQMGPGPSPFVHMGGHTATVLAPPGAATTVTVLQGEMFQTSPVQTVCPHCQQAIVTRISHDIGFWNTLCCQMTNAENMVWTKHFTLHKTKKCVTCKLCKSHLTLRWSTTVMIHTT